MAKRRASQELVIDAFAADVSQVRISPLGAGQEVGRSCIIVEYQGKKVMLDCGIHPGLQGEDSLPYLNSKEELDNISVALITHFHLDHCAAVPYLLSRTTFKGRIFMTHPTKAIFYQLLTDFVNLSDQSADKEDKLATRQEVDYAMDKIEVIDFDQTITVDGIKFTAYRAGHVLGAAMFMVDINGMRCLYTGDYSRVDDRHMPKADIPPVSPHIVIVESTYGTSCHQARQGREKRFIEAVTSTVRKGGKVLLPIVAIGRAQELLLLLDDVWSRKENRDIQKVPVIQASGVAKKALSVFQTYVGMMNEDIQLAMQYQRNPFDYRFAKVIGAGGALDSFVSQPCVIMATPSMLQSGLSRQLFEEWCDSEQNTIIICDFAVQGTMAREVQLHPQTILTKEGTRKPLRCRIEVNSFSAHADFDQTKGFLAELKPPHVVLVHGEYTGMQQLAKALQRHAAEIGCERTVYMPKSDHEVLIPFKQQHVAYVKGRLAEHPVKEGQALRGVLVQQHGRDDQVLHPEDMSTFTKLTVGKIMHRQAVTVTKPFSEVRLALEVMFEGVEGSGLLPVKSVQQAPTEVDDGSSSSRSSPPADGELAVCVGDIVTVRYRPDNAALGYTSHVVLEWAGGSKGDVVADAVLAVLLQTAGEPNGAATAEATRQAALASGDVAGALHAEMQLVGMLLQAQFGPVKLNETMGQIQLQVDGTEVMVHMHGKVVCESEALRGRIEKVMHRITEALRPCALDFED